MIIRIFIRELFDRYMQIETFKHLTKTDRSLKDIYTITKNTNKNKNVIKKLVNEESCIKEFEYF